MIIDIETVRSAIADQSKLPVEKLHDETIINEMIADSFAMVEMMLALQEDFAIALSQEDIIDVKTVGEIIELVIAKVKESQAVTNSI